MVKVLPAIFSYEDMKSKFNQDNPDEPYTRRSDLESGIYALDSWLIRVDDDNKAISTVGFKEHPSHTVVGGMYATAKGRQIGGNNRALQDAREPQLNPSKPLVAAFGHRDGDNSRWIANAKKNGWSFPDSANWQQMSQSLPQDVLNAWVSRYPENMAIRSIRGQGEFAKCVYLDDPTPAWFGILKSKKGGWKDILKVLPPEDWTDYSYAEVDDASNDYGSAKETNIGNTKYIARKHYISAVKGRNEHGTTATDTDDFPKWIKCVKNLGKGNYWMYANDSPTQKHIILVDIIGQGDKFPASRTGKVVNRTVTNYEGIPVEKVIIFSNYLSSKVGNLSHRKRIDCYPGIKLKQGHEKYAKGRSIEVGEEKEETKDNSNTPSVSKEELIKEAKAKINKILQAEINFDLPSGFVEDLIDKQITKNRKRKIYIGKNQRKEVEQALKVIYQ